MMMIAKKMMMKKMKIMTLIHQVVNRKSINNTLPIIIRVLLKMKMRNLKMNLTVINKQIQLKKLIMILINRLITIKMVST